MATTYELISSYTVGSGGVGSITFNSIANTWTDLLIKFSGATGAGGPTPKIRFNGDTSGSYNEKLLVANPSVASASASSSDHFEWLAMNTTWSGNYFGSTEIYIPNYAGGNNKSASSDSAAENNSTSTWALYLDAGLWTQTSAISSISIYAGSNFLQYSTAYLYGIKNS